MTRMIVRLPGWGAFLFIVVPMFASTHLPIPIGTPIAILPFFLWLFSLHIESTRAYRRISTKARLILPSALLYVLVYGYVFNSHLFSFKVLLPFHLIGMVCIFAPLYYVASAVRSAELKRNASVGEWLPTFMGLWFFPFGVWFVQAKIRKIASSA